jgi:peptidoglycan/xylan/chitin deacetylase (PgdA/CDA1 family)
MEYYDKYAIPSLYDTGDVMFIKYMLQVVLPEELRREVCNYLFNKYVSGDEDSFSRELYMSIDQLKDMRNEGMHVGSHGYDHYWLSSLNKEQQEREIDESLKFLKNAGVDLNNWTMCYPYGDYNKETVEILESRNCKLALTTRPGIANLSSDGRFELPRLDTNEIPKNALAEPNFWYQKD